MFQILKKEFTHKLKMKRILKMNKIKKKQRMEILNNFLVKNEYYKKLINLKCMVYI